MQESKPRTNPLSYSDFRSDTATAPTADMFSAMMTSSLGDDVYNEDDSVKTLENYVATLCGHQAALFCASGTMTNQLAHRVHLCNPPQSAMVDIRSHVFNYEAGGISFHSQAAVYPVMPSNGKYLTAEDIASKIILDVDVHYAPTRVISLENTLNGTVMPVEEIERIRALTHDHDIRLHLDGARLWHAALATGVSMKEYCGHFDSISLCLSKGIGAPIGSILVGSEQFIKKARHFRLLFGGGWRQAGILAEAALWGIKNNWKTMAHTHKQAKFLESVFELIGCTITNDVDTNMVWVDTSDAGFTVEELMAELGKEGIKISGSGHAARIVLHYQITNAAIERFTEVLRKIAYTQEMKIAVELALVSWQREHQREKSIVAALPAPTPLATVNITAEIEQSPAKRNPRASIISTKGSIYEEPPVTETPKPLKRLSIYQQLMPRSKATPNPVAAGKDQEVPPSPSPLSPKTLWDQEDGDAHCPQQQEGQQQHAPRHESESGMNNNKPLERNKHLRQSFSHDSLVSSSKSESQLRNSQSLDLNEIEARAANGHLQLDRPHTADKKKSNKLQYRLSHNPASKAIKRASVRFSTLLQGAREA